MLEHPSASRVSHRDNLREPSLQTRPERTDLCAKIPNADFCKAVALRVVAFWVFFADLLHVAVVGLYPELLQRLLH